MRPGSRSPTTIHRGGVARAPLVALVTLCACSAPDGRAQPRIARAIERTLGDRLGAAVRARCLGLVDACVAELAGGPALPIATAREPDGAWAWQVDGIVIDTAPLAAYLRAELAALGAAQEVTCGARFRRAAPGERLACALAGGGLAFATVRADGQPSLEIALDPAAAAARAQAEADAAADAALDRASRALAADPGADDPVADDPGTADPSVDDE